MTSVLSRKSTDWRESARAISFWTARSALRQQALSEAAPCPVQVHFTVVPGGYEDRLAMRTRNMRPLPSTPTCTSTVSVPILSSVLSKLAVSERISSTDTLSFPSSSGVAVAVGVDVTVVGPPWAVPLSIPLSGLALSLPLQPAIVLVCITPARLYTVRRVNRVHMSGQPSLIPLNRFVCYIIV